MASLFWADFDPSFGDSQAEMPPPPPPPQCSGCGQLITDRFILRVAPDLQYHSVCLKCSECGRSLDESCTTFIRDGRLFCRDDYLRLFSRKCSRCRQSLHSEEMVMRGAVGSLFHPHCFCCSLCSRRLRPGDHFAAADDDRLFCQPECRSWEEKSSSESSVSSAISSIPSTSAPIPTKSKSKREKSTQRMRTVLSEDQLKILKQMYTLNQRPDATTKEHLVEQTGLCQRVIRVWFQNRRCKDKKKQTALREAQQHQEKEQTLHGVRMSGVGPIVAVSPVPLHEGSLHPVDIRQYPQNPSLWSSDSSSSIGDLSFAASLMSTGGQSAFGAQLSPDFNGFVGAILPNSSLSSSPARSD